MNKEQLKQEAEEYFKNLDNCRTKELIIEAYLVSALPREKRIAELEAQNEKMKRCIICKHYSSISGCSYHSNWVKDCKENGMKLFELKEIKEK